MISEVDKVIQAYATFIQVNGTVTRDDLIKANVMNEWDDNVRDVIKMRIVDSYVGILVELGVVEDDGTTTTFLDN